MKLCPPTLRGCQVLALGAALALTGCGASTGAGGGDAPDVAASTASLLPPAEGTTSYPLTLTSWAGETVLPERPERIAVIGFSTNMDVLEVIGATPVYALTEESEWEWRDQDWVAGIEVVDTATRRDPINFEAIAASEPDLVVALNSIADEGEHQRLSDIAPVLEYSEQLGDQADWRLGQELVGEALDLAAASRTAVQEADRVIADVAAAHPEYAGATITIATDYGEETGMQYYTTTGGTAETFFTELGFEPNPLAQGFVDDPVVAEESLAQLDADVLVLCYFDQATQQARESGELFQTLPPVTEDRYVPVVTDQPGSGANVTWVLRRGASALSLPWAAEVIADTWLADVDVPG